jgi:succinate dehydrogenase / fumarate reductase flavoprotein subunit
VEGLFCAGDLGAGGWRQSSQGGYVFGARAGRNAAEYVKKAQKPKINKKQVEAEKQRVLKALNVNPRDGYNWIALEDKIRRIATDYGPPLTSDPKLVQGLKHLERIKTRYLPKLFARNPREMMRVSEVQAVAVVVEAFLRSALFRKESRQNTCSILYKTEYPERDDKNWLKHTLLQNVGGEMKLSTRDVKRLNKK